LNFLDKSVRAPWRRESLGNISGCPRASVIPISRESLAQEVPRVLLPRTYLFSVNVRRAAPLISIRLPVCFSIWVTLFPNSCPFQDFSPLFESPPAFIVLGNLHSGPRLSSLPEGHPFPDCMFFDVLIYLFPGFCGA